MGLDAFGHQRHSAGFDRLDLGFVERHSKRVRSAYSNSGGVQTNLRIEEFESSSEHGALLVFDRSQSAQDPSGDIRTDLWVFEGFSRSGKVDAVGVAPDGTGDFPDVDFPNADWQVAIRSISYRIGGIQGSQAQRADVVEKMYGNLGKAGAEQRRS